MVVSIPTWLRLDLRSREEDASVLKTLPMQHVLFRMRDGASDADIDAVVGQLERVLRDSAVDADIFDFREVEDTLEAGEAAMGFFFLFTTVLAMFISFFSLTSSMYTNIHEQAKEIGVLMAIGTPQSYIKRMYVYEAFVLVLAASIIGIAIGMIIAVTLTLQQIILVQLPLPFVFPWAIVLTVFVVAILLAFAATWGPARAAVRLSVVKLLKS